MHSALRKVDMNLLLVFDALYRHASVTDAANELALSPSAVSHALTRLRESLDDPLFVRSGKRMLPTLHAKGIAEAISASLARLSSCLQVQTTFVPQSSQQTFTFAATDYTAAVILPGLIAAVHRQAPGVVIKLIYSQDFNADEDLLSGRVDFALGYEEEPQRLRAGIEEMTCLTDDYAVAVRRGHPTINTRLTKEDYLSAGHVVVRPWLERRGEIDRYLESQQLSRHIVTELPSLMIAPLIISQTDLVMTLPKRGIASLFNMKNLQVFAPPFPTPQYTLKAYYSQALGQSSGHQWMRSQISMMCE